MKGFITTARIVWSVLIFSFLIGGYYLMLGDFFSGFDPLTKVLSLLGGVSILLSVIFIEIDRRNVIGGKGL